MQLLAPIYLFLKLIQGAFCLQNGKNVSRIVKILHSAKGGPLIFPSFLLTNGR